MSGKRPPSVPVSLRMHAPLIADLKTLAKLWGVGYQTLAREAIGRYVADELKRLGIKASEGG